MRAIRPSLPWMRACTTNEEYQWQVNRVGLWEDLDDVSGDYTGTDTDELTVNNPVSTYNGYRYRVIVSGECTPPVISAEALLVIDERPEVLTDPVDQDVCEDGELYFVVHPGNTTIPVILWEYSTDGTTWDPASGLAEVTDDTNDTLFVSSIPSTYNNMMFHAVLSGKCPAPVTSDSAVMTVWEKPQIDTHPKDTVACEQDTVFFFTNAGPTTAPAYQWEIWNGAAWTNPPAGIYEGVNTDTMYINGIHSGIDGLQVRLRLSGICTPGQISDTAMLTVHERPEVVAQPVDVTICEGDSTLFGVSAGVTTSPVYTWQYSTDGVNWNAATGGFFEDEDTDTLKLYGAAGVDSTWTGTQFRAIISNSCGPDDTSMVADLVVNIRPWIDVEPEDAETCEGVSTSFTVDAGTTSFPAYQWEFHNGTTWAPATGTRYSGLGTNTLAIPNPTSDMHGYGFRVVVSGYCGPTVTSDSVSLTVNENAEIILEPVDATICEGSDTVFIVDEGETTNPDFEWWYNDGTSGWDVVPSDVIHTGTATNTLVITGATFAMDNWQYRCEVTGDCGLPAVSDPAVLVVYRRPEIITQPGDTTTCEMLNVAFTVDVGDTDTPFLQWEEFDGSDWNTLTDGGNYIGTHSTELKVFAVDSAMTGFRYRVRVQGECEPEELSDEATLIVESAPDIWVQPVDSTICEGDNAAFEIMATGTTIDYFWQVDEGGGFGDITDSDDGVYAGWDSDMLELTAPDRDFNFNKYRVRVEGACVPLAISNLAILYVQTPPEIQDQPSQDTICEFENATFTVDVTGQGLAYQWQESADGGNNWTDMTDEGLVIGSTSPSMTIFSVDRSYDGTMYQVVITGTCGLPVTSDAVLLTVETAPDIITQPVALTACEGLPAGFKVEAEGTNITYQWQVNEGGGFLNIPLSDSKYTGADSDSLTLLSAQPSQAGWSFRVVVSGNCPNPATTNPVIMLVNPNPVIDEEPADDALCEDGTTTFSADVSGVDLVYQWMVDRDGNGFVTLTDDSVHVGSNTDQILLSNIPTSQDGWQYRLDVTSACEPISTAEVTLTVWPNPVPDIVPVTSHDHYPLICGGDLLTLNGNPTSGSGTWDIHQWSGSVGPLDVIDEQVVDFTTTLKGTYDLAYTVTDSRGCKGSDVVTIENERPNAQFVSDAVPSCGYMEVDFTNTSSAEAERFLWDFDDESTSTQEDVTHGFDNTDPTGQVAYYNISMVATSEHDCSDTARSVVTIYPKIVATIEADTTEGCHPLTVNFVSQPGGSYYYWDFGDGTAAQEGGYLATHIYQNFTSAVQVRTVSLTTRSHYGCEDTKTLDITVQPIPQPNFTAAPMSQTYPDATVTFTNNTQMGPWTFSWDFGDSTSSDLENPVHEYAEPGNYEVVFTVMNGACQASTSTTVVILPRLPVAAFAKPQGGCDPVTVDFENESLWADEYMWDFGDGSRSRQENPTHTYYDVGQWIIRLEATGAGGTSYVHDTVYIYEMPKLEFNWSPDSVFVRDKPVTFFNLTTGATNYYWDFDDYDPDTGEPATDNFSTARDTSHIYFTEGWKDVTLTAWNDHCIDSITRTTVKVIPKGQLEFPTVFRPDPSGPSSGFVDPNDPDVDPNYANSIFFPGINQQVREYHLYIYNRWGELIFQSHDVNYGWNGYINDVMAAQGVYFWKVEVVYKNGHPDDDAGDITLLHKKEQ